MTTGKTIALTRQTFVGKVMSLLFNKLCQFSRSVMSDSLQPHESQHTRPPCPSPTPRVYPNWLVGFGLFQWVNSSHEVAKVLEFHPQHQSFQWTPRTGVLSERLVASPCSPRDSQESSPTPQLKSINSSVLSFLYGPPLTSILDYWKNHSFD